MNAIAAGARSAETRSKAPSEGCQSGPKGIAQRPARVQIELPFPPASLSGHNTGHWRSKSDVVAKHRAWAKNATLAAGAKVNSLGDIPISVTFYPPDRRGDRTNFANRMKPYFDGIADALKVNDRRFLPSYHFGLPEKVGRVVVVIG